MWRNVVQKRGASTGRRCARQNQKMLGATAGAARTTPVMVSSSFPSVPQARSFSSAQPSPWDDSSPFAMSSAPSLSRIPNPTAERVVMKSFLDTLQVSAVNINAVENEGQMHETVIESVKEEVTEVTQEWSLQVRKEQEMNLVAVSSVTTVPAQDAEQHAADPGEANDTSTTSNAHSEIEENPFLGRLVHALRTKDAAKAKEAFRECLKNNVELQERFCVQLFNLAMPSDPIAGLAALKHYRKIMGKPANIALYAKLCESVGNVDWKVARMGQFTRMCNELREELVELKDEEYQKKCFPILLVSLVEQPMHRIGRMASGLYKFMEENDFPLTTGKMCHLLNASKYTRQEDLSFPTILARLVNEGYRPHPLLAVHVLQNLFPYTNLNETILTMKSIIQLQSSWEPGNPHPNYKVDIGTLEHIMAAAARKGSFELNILVWDLVDMLGYEPTVSMYENTLQGFVMGVRQDHNVFAVLGEMEERGFLPSRALIRSLSRSIRFSTARFDFGYNLLTSQQTEGAKITLSSLNVLLSTAGELGDVDRAFATFDDFDLHEIEPNSDSYSFLLEALTKSINPEFRKDEEQRKQDVPGRMDAASAILTLMEEKNVPMCHHCIEQYAQLLFYGDRLDAATEFVLDSLERGDPVNNRVIINLSKNNAMAGNFEMARLLSTKTSEHFSHLDHRINVIEKRARAGRRVVSRYSRPMK